MKWLKKLGQYAPDIAAAIATGGTSVIASTALRIAAKEVAGDEGATVQQLEAAVQGASHEQMVEMVKANNAFIVQLEQIDVDRLRTVNSTMQVESESEHWPQYMWRPVWGFVSAAAFIVLVVFVCALAWKAITTKSPEAMAMIPNLISQFTMLFGIPGAILGVTAWHRGKEKRAKAGDHGRN